MKITNSKPTLSTIAAAALIIGLAGCGSSAETSTPKTTPTTTTTTTPAAPPTTTTAPKPTTAPTTPKVTTAKPAAKTALITIKDFKFSVPASVAPGSKVTIKNEDGENHTVTSTTKGAFDAQADAGSSTTFTAPSTPGSYPFTCTFHSTMKGQLVIK